MFLGNACSLKSKKDSIAQTQVYYVSVPITQFSSINAPCLEVQIEDHFHTMELDLGFRGDITLENKYLEKISPTYIQSKTMYGIRGKAYQTNLYRLPKIRIGDMAFYDSVLQEHNAEFDKDSVFVREGTEPSPAQPGRLGWQLFYPVNLLIDVSKSTIAFCDSLETLKQQGYLIDRFVEVPLLIDRGIIEFIAETPDGSMVCSLDTGSTVNMLNEEIEEENLSQLIWDPQYTLNLDSLKIGSIEFGPIRVHRFPIKLPIRIDVSLGMEFFNENLVFIDFTKKKIYFSKN